MAQSSDPGNTRYLPTGWRVVGSGADRVAERAAAYAGDRLEPGAPADTLYAVQCTMEPVVNGRTSVERVLDAMADEVRATWPACPRLIRDTPVSRPPSRFGGLEFDVLPNPGKEWVGEAVWRAAHPVVAGAAITTHVVLEERAAWTRLSVRVTADHGLSGVRGYVGAGHAQPSFLKALRPELALTWLGGPLAAHTLDDGAVRDFVASVLEFRSRPPVVVLAPLEDGTFVVDPDDLAWELLGRARLHVMREHRVTFRLSDTVGDRTMSCYWGAARCYMPDWSRHDSPLDHPLLVADRLSDPIMRATWLGEIGVFTGAQLDMPPSVASRRPPPPPPPVAESEPEPTAAEPETVVIATSQVHDSAAPPPQPQPPTQPQPDVTPVLMTLVDEVRALGAKVVHLNAELERLRTIAAVRASSTSAIERRLGRLEDILEEAFPDGRFAGNVAHTGDAADAKSHEDETGDHADDDGRPSLVGVVRDAAESWSDALVFPDSAYDSAAASPYEDPERVRAVLEAMALVARRRRDGSLGTSLRDAFGDLGIDYRVAIAKNTSARLREQYRFTWRGTDMIEAEEHIALGNTYDPRRCLRIYFSSRVPNEPRFVICHVGRHFEVKTTT